MCPYHVSLRVCSVPQQTRCLLVSHVPTKREIDSLRYMTTTTFTSQPECHFSPPTEVILVRPTLYLLSCVLIPRCQDEEKVRTVVTRLLGELP